MVSNHGDMVSQPVDSVSNPGDTVSKPGDTVTEEQPSTYGVATVTAVMPSRETRGGWSDLMCI